MILTTNILTNIEHVQIFQQEMHKYFSKSTYHFFPHYPKRLLPYLFFPLLQYPPHHISIQLIPNKKHSSPLFTTKQPHFSQTSVYYLLNVVIHTISRQLLHSLGRISS